MLDKSAASSGASQVSEWEGRGLSWSAQDSSEWGVGGNDRILNKKYIFDEY